MSFIINDKLLTEHKSLRWFDWFNKDSKYRRMDTGYVPVNKYFEFYCNFNKFIDVIELLTTNAKYYNLSNNIFVYIEGKDNDKIDHIRDFGLKYLEDKRNVLFNMCMIAHLWNLSLLDVFILTFWKTKLSINPLNNCDFNTDDSVLYRHIISAINTEITYRDNGHWLHINCNISDRYDALVRRLNDLQIKFIKNNDVINKQYIELFRTFVSVINLSIAINNKYIYIGSKYEFIHYPMIVKKFDTDVYDNIIDILCTEDVRIQDEFINHLKEYNNNNNVSHRLVSLFLLLITRTNKLFGDSNYEKVKKIKKYYSMSGCYISNSSDFNKSPIKKQEISDISIYNINKSNNNSNNVVINNTYFIKRDKFNLNYKRIYKCVGIINNIDACVMVDISPVRIPSQQYVLSEADCEYLGIEYQDGLEVFSNKLNWINIDNNK